jgi:outer membrane receptor for ferrienterochelin and colicins
MLFRRAFFVGLVAVPGVAVGQGHENQVSSQHNDTAANRSAREHVSAQTRAQALGTLVVTASRRPQKLADVAVTTQVISNVEIKRSGAPDLHSLLTRYVGVQPENGVFVGGGVQLQGLGSERVLVLIDGQPLAGRIDGRLDISRVPVSVIQRVEVVKGPQSTLYGSAAMGGVINVITRGAIPGRPRAGARLTGGSQGRIDANIVVQGGTGKVYGLVGIGRRRLNLEGGRADQTGARDRRWDADGKVTVQLGENSALDASFLAVSEDQRWRTGQLYYFSDNDQMSGRTTLTTTRGRFRVAPTLYVSSFDHLSRGSTLPEPVSDSGGRTRELSLKAELPVSVSFDDDVLDAGVELHRDRLETSRISGNRRTFDTFEPYAQYTMTAGRLTLVPGVRLSNSDQWGTRVTPKMALMFRPFPAVALRASFGAGFRAPEFKELYLNFANLGYYVRGNPELRPETSRNVTAGAEWTGATTYVRVQGYVNSFQGFIETGLVTTPLPSDPTGVTLYTYQNVDRGVTRGGDFEAGYTVGSLALEGSYGFLEAYERNTKAALLDRAKHSARLSADYVLPFHVQSDITAMYTGRTPVSRDDAGVVTTYRDPFFHVDGRLARDVTPHFGVSVGVNNIFNTRARLWPGPTERQWYTGLTLDRAF